MSGKNLGLNVRHDLDIEPATRSVPSPPGNVLSTRSDGLLIGYKVARQFESHPLRQRVFSFRDSLITRAKSAHLAGIRQPRSTGETISSGSNASFEDFSLFALWAVDLACRWASAGRLLTGACSDRRRKSEGSLLRRPVHRNIKTASPQ